MTVMTATAARTNLYNLIDRTKDFHKPIFQKKEIMQY